MVNGWWLVGLSFVYLLLSICTSSVAYRHGIWDGAFNHFLPIVQKEMRYYNSGRAAEILGREDHVHHG